jgi:hypothetical protein
MAEQRSSQQQPQQQDATTPGVPSSALRCTPTHFAAMGNACGCPSGSPPARSKAQPQPKKSVKAAEEGIPPSSLTPTPPQSDKPAAAVTAAAPVSEPEPGAGPQHDMGGEGGDSDPEDPDYATAEYEEEDGAMVQRDVVEEEDDSEPEDPGYADELPPVRLNAAQRMASFDAKLAQQKAERERHSAEKKAQLQAEHERLAAEREEEHARQVAEREAKRASEEERVRHAAEKKAERERKHVEREEERARKAAQVEAKRVVDQKRREAARERRMSNRPTQQTMSDMAAAAAAFEAQQRSAVAELSPKPDPNELTELTEQLGELLGEGDGETENETRPEPEGTEPVVR